MVFFRKYFLFYSLYVWKAPSHAVIFYFTKYTKRLRAFFTTSINSYICAGTFCLERIIYNTYFSVIISKTDCPVGIVDIYLRDNQNTYCIASILNFFPNPGPSKVTRYCIIWYVFIFLRYHFVCGDQDRKRDSYQSRVMAASRNDVGLFDFAAQRLPARHCLLPGSSL